MKTGIFSAALILILGFGAPAHASTVEYLIDQSNVLSGGTPYLSIKISDVGDDFAFEVSVLPSLPSAGNNFGIKTFGFNGSLLNTANIVFTNDAAGKWEITSSNSTFGTFNNTVKASKGKYTVETLTFTIIKSGDLLSDYTSPNALSNLFVAHVIDINTGTGDTSAWFTGTKDTLVDPNVVGEVPVPAAAWLLGSGLLGFVGASRRKVAG